VNEDNTPLLEDKSVLRGWAKARRAGLDMAALSTVLVARLAALPEFKAARDVLLYLAMAGEINVEGLLALGDGRQRFYVPRCAPKRRLAVYRYVPGETPLINVPPFGIREPDRANEANPAALDLVVVPSLLLSEGGDRLGYGGGYYDRFLPRLRSACITVSALPDALITPRLPRDPWDIPVDVVVTETRLLPPPGDGPAPLNRG
jgi:5-formyltetrahydrofolate cyclo-ligase